MLPIETTRLRIRELISDDAPFIRELLNEPSFMAFIGDRGVRSNEDAVHFTETRYRQSYRDHGFGLYLVELRESLVPLGICGFVWRDTLPHPDIGFAFLQRYEGHGYAFEAAQATLHFGFATLAMPRVLAIVQPDNVRSHRLLLKLGFHEEGVVTMPGDEAALALYALDAGPPQPPASEAERGP
jgi:[ribosomal protein S5]-alanine N-acetyltransferase